MPESSAASHLAELFRTGAPLVHCDLVEDWKLVRLCRALPGGPAVWSWSSTGGLVQVSGAGGAEPQPAPPQETPPDADAALVDALNQLCGEDWPPAGQEAAWVLVMRDAVGTNPLPPLAVRLLKDLYLKLGRDIEQGPSRAMILLTGRGWTPPPALSGLVSTLVLPLPTEDEIRHLAAAGAGPLSAAELASRARGLSEPAARFLIRQLRGGQWTREEAIQRVNEAKLAGVRATQLLDIVVEPPEVRLGGFQRFQAWFQTRVPFFMGQGNPALQPRGVLLLGFPGCGKSHAARWVAHQLRVPLVTMDIGRIQDRWVGSSESRMREALMTLEAAAPVVLFLDEIEKAIAGNQSDSSGVTTRLVGQLLTWLQERQRPIFVVATCNKPNIPPELTRAGRFDALFVVRPPDDQERASILEAVTRELDIHIPPEVRAYVLQHTGPARQGFTGAELRQLVIEASYHAGPDARALTQESVARALPYVSPLVRRPDGQELLQRYSTENLGGYQEVS